MRQALAREKLESLAQWLDVKLSSIPGKGDLAKAIRYARSRWAALTAYVDDGRLEMSNNATENAVRPITLGRKNGYVRINLVPARSRGPQDRDRNPAPACRRSAP